MAPRGCRHDARDDAPTCSRRDADWLRRSRPINENRFFSYTYGSGRLKTGVSLEQAQRRQRTLPAIVDDVEVPMLSGSPGLTAEDIAEYRDRDYRIVSAPAAKALRRR